MKDKDKSSQKKSTGSARVRSAKRPASGSSTRRIEIKHAEEALRASEKKFSAIFNASPDPTTITDIETGRIIALNEAAAQWFGRSREEAIGMTTAEVQAWADPTDRDRMVLEIRSKGEINDRVMRKFSC